MNEPKWIEFTLLDEKTEFKWQHSFQAQWWGDKYVIGTRRREENNLSVLDAVAALHRQRTGR